jgi:uncharacterized membrane protein
VKLQALAVTASLAGVGVSIYLTAVHYAGVPLACPTGAAINCETVLSSAYGVIAGSAIPTSMAGVAWFIVSAALWTQRRPRAQLAWSVAGLITVIYLVFVEIVRLGTICVWCSVAHLLVVAIFFVALVRNGRAPEPIEEGQSRA